MVKKIESSLCKFDTKIDEETKQNKVATFQNRMGSCSINSREHIRLEMLIALYTNPVEENVSEIECDLLRWGEGLDVFKFYLPQVTLFFRVAPLDDILSFLDCVSQSGSDSLEFSILNFIESFEEIVSDEAIVYHLAKGLIDFIGQGNIQDDITGLFDRIHPLINRIQTLTADDCASFNSVSDITQEAILSLLVPLKEIRENNNLTFSQQFSLQIAMSDLVQAGSLDQIALIRQALVYISPKEAEKVIAERQLDFKIFFLLSLPVSFAISTAHQIRTVLDLKQGIKNYFWSPYTSELIQSVIPDQLLDIDHAQFIENFRKSSTWMQRQEALEKSTLFDSKIISHVVQKSIVFDGQFQDCKPLILSNLLVDLISFTGEMGLRHKKIVQVLHHFPSTSIGSDLSRLVGIVDRAARRHLYSAVASIYGTINTYIKIKKDEFTFSMNGLKEYVARSSLKQWGDRLQVCKSSDFETIHWEGLKENRFPRAYVVLEDNHYMMVYVIKDKKNTYTAIVYDSLGDLDRFENLNVFLPEDWEKVFLHTLDKEEKLDKLQKDRVNCGFFALDAAHTLLKHPEVAHQIIQSKVRVKNAIGYGIPKDSYPWRLYVTAQSVKNINTMSQKFPEDTRKQFLQKVQKHIEKDTAGKERNMRVEKMSLDAERLLVELLGK